jgi:hypothetical protein
MTLSKANLSKMTLPAGATLANHTAPVKAERTGPYGALDRAVNRAIASGSPVFVNQPVPTFPRSFRSYVCAGDSIETEVDGFTVTATIVRDESSDAPDERQDGFWPSDDPKEAKAMAKAESIMDSWKNDEWWYVGVVLSVERNGIMLSKHAASLWGVEANYPGSDNSYLTDTANALLSEALDAGRAALAELNESRGTKATAEPWRQMAATECADCDSGGCVFPAEYELPSRGYGKPAVYLCHPCHSFLVLEDESMDRAGMLRRIIGE